MNGYANNRRDQRFFTGDRSELQEIKSRESLQKFVRHNKNRKSFFRLTFVAVFSVICILFLIICLAVFFKIENVEIIGSSRYTADEIMELCGIETGQSLYEVGASDLSVLPEKLAYISSAKLSRKLPNTLVITVVEDKGVCFCELYGEYFVLSDKLRVLDCTDSAPDGLIRLELPELDSAIVGRQLGFTNDSDAKYVNAYLAALYESQVYPLVSAFDLRDKFSLEMICSSIYLIKLDSGEDLPTKLSAAAAVLSSDAFTDDTPALIDITDPAKISAIINRSVDVSFSRK